MKLFLAPMKCSTSMTGRLVAMAPRVAKVTDSTVAMQHQQRARRCRRPRRRAPWRACGRQAAMVVEARGRHLLGERLAQLREIGRGTGAMPHHDHARHRQIVEREAAAEPRLEQPRRFLLGIGPHLGDARRTRGRWRPPCARPLRCRGRAAGRTWMVTSRATSDCQSLAAARTSITAPVVSEARKVMMATTATSARPAIDRLRHDRRLEARQRRRGERPPSSSACARRVSGIVVSIVDMQPALVQHEPAGVVLVHQRDVVGGDHDRGARIC